MSPPFQTHSIILFLHIMPNPNLNLKQVGPTLPGIVKDPEKYHLLLQEHVNQPKQIQMHHQVCRLKLDHQNYQLGGSPSPSPNRNTETLLHLDAPNHLSVDPSHHVHKLERTKNTLMLLLGVKGSIWTDSNRWRGMKNLRGRFGRNRLGKEGKGFLVAGGVRMRRRFIQPIIRRKSGESGAPWRFLRESYICFAGQ